MEEFYNEPKESEQYNHWTPNQKDDNLQIRRTMKRIESITQLSTHFDPRLRDGIHQEYEKGHK